MERTVASISLAVAIIAIILATVMYRKENPLPAKMKQALPALWDWCYHRFYWDELYMFITKSIIFQRVCKPIAWFDRHIIDGTMDGFALLCNPRIPERKHTDLRMVVSDWSSRSRRHHDSMPALILLSSHTILKLL